MDRGTFGRKDRLVKEKRHDAYRSKQKWPEPTLCTVCGSVYEGGRWTWGSAVEHASRTTCPACQRIADRYPAGILEISGTFFSDHRDEILGLIKNVEKAERDAHPLERIMSMEDADQTTSITFTGIHIARRVGEALDRSYNGSLSMNYGDGAKTVKLSWHR